MPVVAMDQLLDQAGRGGYAVGYFEAWDEHSLEGVLEAAEALAAPVVIGFGGAITRRSWLDQHGIEVLAAQAHTLAARSAVPTAVMLNEMATVQQIERGLACGCNGVMLSTGDVPPEEGVAVTRRVVALAHAAGAWVEAELGELPDALDASSTGHTTDPAQAAEFVARTGVDGLAVSVGNVHALTGGDVSEIDLELLARLHAAVPVPLVLHGGSGVPDGAIPQVITLGVRKINVGTVLKEVFLDGLVEALAATAGVNVQQRLGARGEDDVVARAQAHMKAEVMRRIALYARGLVVQRAKETA